MNKLYSIVCIVVVISCKKSINNDSSANASIIEFSLFEDKPIKIDSTLVNNSKDELFKDFYKIFNLSLIHI